MASFSSRKLCHCQHLGPGTEGLSYRDEVRRTYAHVNVSISLHVQLVHTRNRDQPFSKLRRSHSSFHPIHNCKIMSLKSAMRGPDSNSEILGKFTAFYKNAHLFRFSENQAAVLFRSSYLDSTFHLTDFLVKLTAVECHQISLQNNKNVHTGFSLIEYQS